MIPEYISRWFRTKLYAASQIDSATFIYVKVRTSQNRRCRDYGNNSEIKSSSL